RAVLAPAGHAPVHEARIACPADVGPESEPFGDTRAVALDEHVGALDEAEHGLDPVAALEIDGDRTPAPAEQIARRRHIVSLRNSNRPIDAHDIGAEIGQHHGGKRTGTDSGELDDTYSVEGTAHESHGVTRSGFGAPA